MNEKSPYAVGIQPYIAESSHQHAVPIQRSRSPFAIITHAPWLAILALICAFLCAAASTIIIIVSDDEVAHWKLQPSVIIALLSAITSALLLVVLRYGVAISWWRAVYHPQGTTLAKLHHIWDHGGGGGIYSALFAGRNMTKITVASVFIAVTGIVYSPLLQRATHTMSVTRSLEGSLMIDMLEEFPLEAGAIVGSGGEPNLNYPFLSAIQDWYSGDLMATWDQEGYSCNGTCKGYVSATGIVGNACEQNKEMVNVLEAAYDSFVFSINFTHYGNESVTPTLEMTIKGLTEVSESCVGTLITNVCKIHVGKVNFPVIVKGDNITFDTDRARQFLSEPISYPGDMSSAKPGDMTGPLGALFWFGNIYFRGNSTMEFNKTSGNYSTNESGPTAAQYLDTNLNVTQACQIGYTDPTENIIEAFSDVLFRAAYYWSTNDTTRSFSVSHTQPLLVYRSVYSYLSAATVLVFLAIIIASSTLWGWWELNRKVSLSPLETGKALGPQVLDSVNTPEDADGIVRYVGARKVRFGETFSAGMNGQPLVTRTMSPA